jgi:hypothetical protein
MQFSAKFAAVVAGFSVVVTSFVAWGEEPKACQCPEVGVPILSSLPYLSRCFKNVGVRHEADCPLACQAGECTKTPCAEQLERIGVDFEWHATCPSEEVVRFGPIELAICGEDENCCCRGKEGPLTCAQCKCQAVGKVVVHQAAVCEPSACAAKCGAGSHATAHVSKTACCEGNCGAANCCCKNGCASIAKAAAASHHTAACQCAGRDELWEHLVEMAAEKGAAEAALEARHEHSELLDALVEMATKGAALEAKLEAQAEHHKALARMVELATENAHLKARAELAEAKTALLKETIPLAVEKELLARRVAELEERLVTTDEEVRTTKKATGKKAR